MIELGPSGVTSSGAGVVAEPATPLSEPSGPDASETGSNTAEIPSNNPPSPTKAHIKSHKHDRFGDIQVTIANLQETDPMLHEYQVSGQIAGTGIERAGIFVDGRPAGDIAVGSSGGFATSSFNQGFVFNGHEATIRVFGPHNNYMESSLRTGGVGGPVIAASGNPNQLAIQITGVQPVSSMVSNLSGTVSGKNIQSAGLFQNGVMVQSIAVAGGLLSTFAPSVYHSVNFNAQFNPGGGPAMVRVFDTAGNFVDQPVNGIVAGRFGYGTGTYSGVNPYGGGVNPYGNANPGYSGYNMNPNPRPPAYGSPYSSTPPSSPGSKWWNRYLY